MVSCLASNFFVFVNLPVSLIVSFFIFYVFTFFMILLLLLFFFVFLINNQLIMRNNIIDTLLSLLINTAEILPPLIIEWLIYESDDEANNLHAG